MKAYIIILRNLQIGQPQIIIHYQLSIKVFVVAATGFFLAGLGEAADTFHISDNAGEVIHVLAVAFGTFMEIALVDMATVVANGVGDIEGKVVASFLGSHAEQLAVLGLGEMFLEVGVQCGSTGEVRDVALPVKTELVDQIQRIVLHAVEVAVVTVAGHAVTVLAVPFGMFYPHVFGGNHLAVEEQLFALVLVVVFFDQTEHLFHKMLVLRIVVNGDAEKFGRFHQTVDTDGEVLAVDGDVAGVEQRKHAFGLQVFEVLVVGNLYLMHQVDNLADELELRDIVAAFVLNAAVDVDGEHALGAGGDATCAKGVAETVVLDFVAQAAAAAQRVGVVAHVSEEGVAFGIHFRGEIGVLGVDDVPILGKEGHGFNGESEHGAGALLVEPAHKTFLQPAERIPDGFGAVGEAELTEEAFEIITVVVGHIPEYGLEVARTGGLVDGIDHLLKAVGDHFVDSALAQGEIHHLVTVLIVVVTVFLTDEIVHVHEEFRGGAGAAEHAGDHEDHVDEAAAVRLEVRGGGGVAADAASAVQQPRIHGDGGAVVGDAGLIVLIDEMVVEQV